MNFPGASFWCRSFLVLLLAGLVSPTAQAVRLNEVEWLYKALQELLLRPDFYAFITYLIDKDEYDDPDEALCQQEAYYKVNYYYPYPVRGRCIEALLVSMVDESEGVPAETPGEHQPVSPLSLSPCPFPGPGSSRSEAQVNKVVYGHLYHRGQAEKKYTLQVTQKPPPNTEKGELELFLRISRNPTEEVRFRTEEKNPDILFVSLSHYLTVEVDPDVPAEDPSALIVNPSDDSGEEAETETNLQVEFSLKLGPALFSDIDELIDPEQEFPAVQAFIDESALVAFLHFFEQSESALIARPLGSGISSQVSLPFYFGRSLAVKRTFVVCNTVEEARQVIMCARAYVLQLQKANIPVTPIVYVPVESRETGKVAIYALQKLIPKECFSDFILADPDTPMDKKKQLIDKMLQLQQLCDKYNAEQTLAIGSEGRIFSLAIDMNYPNFCQDNDVLEVADLMPMFAGFAGKLMPGNRFILEMDSDREQLLKSYSTDPLMIHAFFLCMISRRVRHYEALSQQQASQAYTNSHTEMMASQWREIYEYALQEVCALPHIRWAISDLVKNVDGLQMEGLEDDSDARISASDTLLEKMIAESRPMQRGYARWFSLYKFVQEQIKKFRQQSGPYPSLYEQQMREQLPEAYNFVMRDISENLGRRLDELKRKRGEAKKKQVREQQDKEKHIEPDSAPAATSHPHSHGHVILEEDFVQLVSSMFNLSYQPCPSDNDCFWNALHELLAKLLKGKYSLSRQKLKEKILARRRAIAAIQSQSEALDPQGLGWGTSDDLPLVMQEINDSFGEQIAILVIGVGHDYQPTAALFFFDPDQSGQILQEVLIGQEQIQQHLQDPNLIILANHNTHQYGQDINESPAIQHWGFIINDQPHALEALAPDAGLEDEELQDDEPKPKKEKLEADVPESLVELSRALNFRIEARGSEMVTVVGSPADVFKERFLQLILQAMREHLIKEHIFRIHVLAADVFSNETLLQQLREFLPKNGAILDNPFPAGDMQPFHEIASAFLDWLRSAGQPWLKQLAEEHWQKLAIIQPVLGFDPANPQYSVWIISRVEGLEYLVSRQFHYGLGITQLRKLIENSVSRVFFSDSIATPGRNYLLYSGQNGVADWWLMNLQNPVGWSIQQSAASIIQESPPLPPDSGMPGAPTVTAQPLEETLGSDSEEMATDFGVIHTTADVVVKKWREPNGSLNGVHFSEKGWGTKRGHEDDEDNSTKPHLSINVLTEFAVRDSGYERKAWLMPFALMMAIEYSRKKTWFGW